MKALGVQLLLPEDMQEALKRQAASAGMSVDLFVTTAVAVRMGAQAEAERYFTARGARTTPERARAILESLGTSEPVREDDRLDVVDED